MSRIETAKNEQDLIKILEKHELSGSHTKIRLAYSISNPTGPGVLISGQVDLKPNHIDLLKRAQSRLARAGKSMYPLELVYTSNEVPRAAERKSSIPDDVRARLIEGRKNRDALRRAGLRASYSRG